MRPRRRAGHAAVVSGGRHGGGNLPSLLPRRVGHTRAGRLVDMMERRGVVSGYEGSKARQVLITEADLPRVLEQLSAPAVAAPSED